MSELNYKIIYKETYFISAGDTDASGHLSLPLLTSRIIDIATAHANSLGIGNPSMQQLNLGWVLSRLTIEMQEFPPVNSYYCIETWVEDWNRHFSIRSFRISSDSDRTLGFARSVWMVMNTETRENGGLAHLNLPDGVIIDGKNPIERQKRHSLILDQQKEGDTEIPKGAVISNMPTVHHKFKYCDLDAYRHVNTVKYITLILNQFTLEDFDNTYSKRLELSFLREAHYNELIDLRRVDDNLLSSFLLADTKTGEQLLYARLLRASRN